MAKEFFFDNILKYAPLVTTIVSGCTAILAYKVYQSYSQRQFLNKQIEVVTNLLETLNTDHFILDFTTFRGKSRSAEHHSVNIFEALQVKSSIEQNQSKFEDNPVYLDINNNQVLNIKKFIDNPFTPKKIADSLIKFYSTSYVSINHIELGIEGLYYSVVIKSSVHLPKTDSFFMKEGDKHILGNAIALQSWLAFHTCTTELKKEFETWFSKNGIYDLNIRTDFKQSSWIQKEKKEAS